ncbi:MAG: RNA recognition motif domain-containing protein [Thermodesulfovibrionales bacterium]
MGTRLYIGNISFKATEDDIRNLFTQAGEVLSANLITDTATGRLRGFGFVEMANEEAAQQAITLFNGKQFMERAIVVNEAKPQEKKEHRGGGFRDRERRPR